MTSQQFPKPILASNGLAFCFFKCFFEKVSECQKVRTGYMFDFRLLPFSEFNVHFTEFLQVRHPQDHQFHSRPSTCFNPSTRSTINPQSCQPLNPPQHLDTELRINGGDFASLVAFFALHKALRDLDSGRNDSLEGWEFLGKTWRILSGKKNTTITLGKTTWWICFFCWY